MVWVEHKAMTTSRFPLSERRTHTCILSLGEGEDRTGLPPWEGRASS